MFRLALGPTYRPAPWESGALSVEAKRPGHESHHTPPSSADVRNEWNDITSAHRHTFMACTGTTLPLTFVYFIYIFFIIVIIFIEYISS
jgi:hypothetical protein